MFEISLPWLHLFSYNACPHYLKSRQDLLYIAITLTGVRFADMIKRNGFSFSILETRNSSGHRKVMDIEMSEGLSGQILLLRREAECSGLLWESCSKFNFEQCSLTIFLKILIF